MSKSIYELSGFQRDLLFVIAGLERPSGREIGTAIENTQNRNVFHGRLYSNLDTLVRAEFVDKQQHDGRTNLYVLTSKGKCELEALQQWQRRMVSD